MTLDYQKRLGLTHFCSSLVLSYFHLPWLKKSILWLLSLLLCPGNYILCSFDNVSGRVQDNPIFPLKHYHFRL